MTTLYLISRVRLCMDKAHTFEGLHRLALVKYRLITILYSN